MKEDAAFLTTFWRGLTRVLLVLFVLGTPICREINTPAMLAGEAPRPPQASKQGSTSTRDKSSADMKVGRFLFVRDCAHCHGKSGDGNSFVRRTLHPAPLDLTGFEFTESFVLHVLHEGVPGSDMPAWHVSPEEDLRAVSTYTVSLGRADLLLEQERYAPPEALQEAGRRIYVAHCTQCHGESGNGDGKDATRYLPAPPSFQGMRPSYRAARRVIENGVAGTAMSAWPLLTAPEIQAVTYYVRSLYAGSRKEPPDSTGETR